MNKHIILTYESEGSVAGILQVEYEGTLGELWEVILGETYDDEEYHSVEDRLDDLSIEFEYISYLVDHPCMDLFIEGQVE